MLRKIIVLVEGKTELKFVHEILKPHLSNFSVDPIPRIVTTRENPYGSDYKGGTVKYAKVKKQILTLLYDSSAVAVTTMLDFYKLHRTFPHGKTTETHCYKKVDELESKIFTDLGVKERFIPYLQLHEFEALLFSAPDVIAESFDNTNTLKNQFQKIKTEFVTPEEIDDNPSTCPSRRLSNLCIPEYRKAIHGILIAKRIGLQTIRKECPHFNEWLTKLEAFTQ